MTSCVVKWCRRPKEASKKETGITYHAFPKNEIRRLKWTKAVRLERREDDWLPTSASRVCSIHFENEEIYFSPKGNCMLKKSAVPICTMVRKKFSNRQEKSSNKLPSSVPESSKLQKQKVQPKEQSAAVSGTQWETVRMTPSSITSAFISEDNKNSQSHIQECTAPVGLFWLAPSFTDNNKIILLEQHPQEHNPVVDSRTYKNERVLKCPKCLNEFIEQIDQVDEDFIPDNKQNNNEFGDNIEIRSCSTPLNVPSSEDESIFDSPRRYCLKRELKRKSLLAEKRLSKIRNLQRKNKRLKAKNLKLSNILKELKKKGYKQSNTQMALEEFPNNLISSLKEKQKKNN